MDRKICSYIEEYGTNVIHAIQIMKKGLCIETIIDLKRYWISFGQLGEFEFEGKKYHFFYHGIGCRLSWENSEIDWDFGIDENQCIIDPGKLYFYILKNHSDEREYSKADIERQCEILAKEKFLEKKYGHFYYSPEKIEQIAQKHAKKFKTKRNSI